MRRNADLFDQCGSGVRYARPAGYGSGWGDFRSIHGVLQAGCGRASARNYSLPKEPDRFWLDV